MKRQQAPRFWPITRKEHAWAVKSHPGPHALKSSFPLLLVVRDVLGFAKNGAEATTLIKQGKVLVDGVTQKDERLPLGVMDTVELPDAKQAFRVLPDYGGKLRLKPMKGDERGFKLCRIVGKTTVGDGNVQLNLHDGRNLVVPEAEAPYRVNDVLQVKIPRQEIIGHVKFEEGIQAMVTGGRSQGQIGVVAVIGNEPGNKRTATVRTPDGDDVRTLARYVFAVGSGEPLISLKESP
jgi:small subunit ribosomal protein S4e